MAVGLRHPFEASQDSRLMSHCDMCRVSAGLLPGENEFNAAPGQAAEALAKKRHTSDLMAVSARGIPK